MPSMARSKVSCLFGPPFPQEKQNAPTQPHEGAIGQPTVPQLGRPCEERVRVRVIADPAPRGRGARGGRRSSSSLDPVVDDHLGVHSREHDTPGHRRDLAGGLRLGPGGDGEGLQRRRQRRRGGASASDEVANCEGGRAKQTRGVFGGLTVILTSSVTMVFISTIIIIIIIIKLPLFELS